MVTLLIPAFRLKKKSRGQRSSGKQQNVMFVPGVFPVFLSCQTHVCSSNNRNKMTLNCSNLPSCLASSCQPLPHSIPPLYSLVHAFDGFPVEIIPAVNVLFLLLSICYRVYFNKQNFKWDKMPSSGCLNPQSLVIFKHYEMCKLQ